MFFNQTLSKLRTVVYFSLPLMSLPIMSHAAGFQLKEQSADMQGTSFAGATANTESLGTVFYNPAGMAYFEGTHAGINLSFIKPSANASLESVTTGAGGITAADGDGGDAGGINAVPTFYAIKQMNDRVNIGLAVTVPYGLSTEYDDTWAGRFFAVESELQTVNVAPSISYKVDDKLAIGGGIQLQYAKAKLTSRVPVSEALSELEGDDMAFGFNVGAMYNLSEKTRVGGSYRSRIHHTLRGDVKANGVFQANARAKLATPDVISLGLTHQLTEKTKLMAEAAWTNWSLFNDLHVVNDDTDATLQYVDESWEDTYFFSLGAEYAYDDKQTFQFGVAYDKGATDDEHRTFRIPDTDRYWLSLGYKRQLDDCTKLSVGYTHILADDARVSETQGVTGDAVTANMDANVNILAIGLQRKF